MLRQVRPAILMIAVMTIDHRSRLSARDDRARAALLSAPGKRQPGRTGRQGDRVEPDRPELHLRQIFPRPSVSNDRARSERSDKDGSGTLCRRQFGRLEPRTDQPGADRPGQGRRCKAGKGKSGNAYPGRSGDDIGERARPRHHPGRGAVPGAAGGRGAASRPGKAPRSDRRRIRKTGFSAFSARSGSMCWH